MTQPERIDQRIKDAWALEKFYKQLGLLKIRSEKIRSGKNVK